MSRGPGRWQRLIVERAETAWRFDITDVLPSGYSRSEYTAAARAAIRLEALGRVELWKGVYGRRRLIVRSLSVDPADNCPASQRLEHGGP